MSSLVLTGDTSGQVTLAAPAVAGSYSKCFGTYFSTDRVFADRSEPSLFSFEALLGAIGLPANLEF